MSGIKLRAAKTPTDNLISNLRGEVGAVIATWTMWRGLRARERQMVSSDIAKDFKNAELAFISVLADKLKDELIGRLSELAEPKVGRLTFHFASVKLGRFEQDVSLFSKFVQRGRLTEKRNYDISHKELPEQWSEHKAIIIPSRTLLRGIAYASRLMKKIDREVLGPSSKYLWHEMRKKRYILTHPPQVGYMLMPHLNLSNTIREKIIVEEMAEGRQVWSEMPTMVNGKSTTVHACNQWGAILSNNGILVLDRYPLQEISAVNFEEPESKRPGGNAIPIYEQKKITAKFRATDVSREKIVFVPVQRVHLLESGEVTELPNFTMRLGDQIPNDLGALKEGDVKEFEMSVAVLAGYRSAEE